MSSIRYSNGMYKMPSDSQEKTAQNVFTSFYTSVTMSRNFNQSTGLLTCYIDNASDNKCVATFFINRKGYIL